MDERPVGSVEVGDHVPGEDGPVWFSFVKLGSDDGGGALFSGGFPVGCCDFFFGWFCHRRY